MSILLQTDVPDSQYLTEKSTEPAVLAGEVLSFVARTDRLTTTDGIMDAMLEIVGRYGVEMLVFAGVDPDRRFDLQVLAHRSPHELLAQYSRRNYIRFDPIARMGKRATRPFIWDESSWADETDPRAREVMEEAAAFGIKQGLVIPIYGPDGGKSVVGLCGRELTLPYASRPVIHMLALYAFERVQQLAGKRAASKPCLTEREREVLTWVAQGKSAWEIAKILDIAKRTVDEHAQTAYRKLGAVNRTHAVAIALRERIFEA